MFDNCLQSAGFIPTTETATTNRQTGNSTKLSHLVGMDSTHIFHTLFSKCKQTYGAGRWTDRQAGKQMNVSSSSSGRPPTKSHPVPCTCILIKDAKNKHKMQMKQKQSIISHHQPSQIPRSDGESIWELLGFFLLLLLCTYICISLFLAIRTYIHHIFCPI